MIRLSRTPGYGRSGTGNLDDTDALQTDVMRFMSILGLCLMAVFALVQSLPLHDVESHERTAEQARLQEHMAAQRQRARVLDTELQRMLTRVEQTSAQQADRARALSLAEQRLADVSDRTEQANDRRRQLVDELERLQQRLDTGRLVLADLQQTIDDKAASLRTLQQRLAGESRALEDVRIEAREIKQRQADAQALEAKSPALLRQQAAAGTGLKPETKRPLAPRPSKATTTATPKRRTEKQGFTLRFVSDEALRRLIRNGDVQLFAMHDERAWRVAEPERRPLLTDADRPKWFHEMAPSTVPRDYVRQLQVVAEPRPETAVVWGVQLPQVTRQDIASLTKGQQVDDRGGDLVIAADGRVRLAGQ